MATKSYIIALEEHYYDPEVKRLASGLDAIAAPATLQRLDDLGELRLQEMDEAGIDLQVLSHTMPGLQKLDAETAVPLARRANDRLGLRRSTYRSTCIQQSRILRRSTLTTRITSKNTQGSCAPAGALLSRPRRRVFASC